MAGRPGAGQWLRIEWPERVRVASVQLFGGAANAETSVRSGLLRFDDGSTVLVGGLEPSGGAPTTVAFTPRSTRSVRFTVTAIAAGSSASVARFTAYAAGTTPPQWSPSGTPSFATTAKPASACAVPARSAATAGTPALKLLCPSPGFSVGAAATVVVAGPSGAALSVSAFLPGDDGRGGTVRQIASGTISGTGRATLRVPMTKLAHGPTAVRVTAVGAARPLYVQVVNRSGVAARGSSPAFTKNMTLAYSDDFASPVTATRSGAGARYASAKPVLGGSDEFGEAIFAQPTKDTGNLTTLNDDWLRIRTAPLAPGKSDPNRWGRTSTGGMISSAHTGGSGFSAQYGYFEARMLAPAGEGTWPAFWMLSESNLVEKVSAVGEVDAVELYGTNPAGSCQSQHNYGKHTDGSAVRCSGQNGFADWALAWHTYGVRITPSATVYYIDGTPTTTIKGLVKRSDPYFFMINLALGGGWPIHLSGTNGVADLYVDSVKVYV
ncbi:family 16 glycosylhydrolase [uncultured Amnibacterium sp.]|uniref:DUF7402 domain-containing protein n=1 Tax=uncultured Amnibacterium sp. TaxID=1631851 RepID=UPI0035CBD063